MSNVTVKLGVDGRPLKQGLATARGEVDKFKKQAKAGGGLMGGLGGALASLGLAAHAKSVMDYGDSIADLSQRFGVGTDALQKWGNVAEQNGSSLETMAGGLNKLAVNQDKALAGSDEMQAAFADLGVSVEELRSLSPDELLIKIGKGSMNASSMVAALGRSSLELIPTLRAVADGSAELGDVISSQTIARLGAASDTLKGYGQTLKVYTAEFMAGIVDMGRIAYTAIDILGEKYNKWGDVMSFGEKVAAIKKASRDIWAGEDRKAPQAKKVREEEEDTNATKKAANDLASGRVALGEQELQNARDLMTEEEKLKSLQEERLAVLRQITAEGDADLKLANKAADIQGKINQAEKKAADDKLAGIAKEINDHNKAQDEKMEALKALDKKEAEAEQQAKDDKGKAKQQFEETKKQIADDKLLDEYEQTGRMANAGGGRADLRRQAYRDLQATRKADRAFVRKFGAEELKRVKEAKDPEKQAARAFKEALGGVQTTLNETKTEIEQLRNDLNLPQ